MNGMEWNEMEWNGMEWNGMEWNGMECKALIISYYFIVIHMIFQRLIVIKHRSEDRRNL